MGVREKESEPQRKRCGDGAKGVRKNFLVEVTSAGEIIRMISIRAYRNRSLVVRWRSAVDAP